MSEDVISFDLQEGSDSIIKVLGVGGGGGNAVNHMYKQGIKDVDFVLCNTDAQVLQASPVPIKIQLGASLTEGRGAGNEPEQGRQAAIESIDDVMATLGDETKMIFITAGLGGGTGTGAAPIIAKEAKDRGILTVGIVTLPFRFEGNKRVNQAVAGLQEMSQHVDSLLVIDNEKLREVHGDFTISNAFAKADDILTVAVKGIAEIITVKGYVNVDFADVRTVMRDSGVALMGAASAAGDKRALNAIKEALSSPLLNSNDIVGAQNILLNFGSGTEEITLEEVSLINEYVQRAAGNNADLIWGNCVDANLGDKISVTVIATGFNTDAIPEVYAKEMNDRKQTSKVHDKIVDFNEDIILEVDEIIDEDVRNDDEIKVFKTAIVRSDEQKEQNTKKHQEPTEKNQNQQKIQPEKDSDSSFNVKTYRDNLEELENKPAYLRKGYNINLDDESVSPEDSVSNYRLKSKNGRIDLSQGNTYLNDNVD